MKSNSARCVRARKNSPNTNTLEIPQCYWNEKSKNFSSHINFLGYCDLAIENLLCTLLATHILCILSQISTKIFNSIYFPRRTYHNFVGSYSLIYPPDHDYDAFAGLGDNLADLETHSADMDYLNQGNLSRVIDKKTVRKEGI